MFQRGDFACDGPVARRSYSGRAVTQMPPQAQPPRAPRYGLANATRFFVGIAVRERVFLGFIGIGFLAAGVFYRDPAIARWIGFFFAGYAVVANDSIQTIGTFIASNKQQKWWLLWLFVGGIFLVTASYSFWQYNGDVSYGRLTSKGFETTPMSFDFLQVAAPLFLLILTRLRMPVSTTFLLLTSFATTPSSVGKVLTKSLQGYVLAFGLAIVVWLLTARLIDRWIAKGPAHPAWRVAQWITSGTLWAVWLMQDAANVAVYLPRSMSIWQLLAFLAVIFGGLGMLFFLGGDKIQQVVDEKSNVVDVRAATIIDLIYAIILFYFKIHSRVPMSTTWVFIGLLGGREVAMAMRQAGSRGVGAALWVMGKDILYVTVGLIVSLIIAATANDAFREALLASVGW